MRTLETLFVRDRRQPAGTEREQQAWVWFVGDEKKTFVRYLDTA